MHAGDPAPAHQPGDALVVHRPADVAQLSGDPRAAVRPVGLLVNLGDPLGEGLIGVRGLGAGRDGLPPAVDPDRDTDKTAHSRFTP